MDQVGMKKPYLSNRLSAKRIELDCGFCGGRLSLDTAVDQEKISCPFCGASSDERPNALYKQEVALSTRDASLVESGVWRHRYEKQKRWWMRRRFCEKKLEGFIDVMLTGNGRLVAVALGMAVVGGVLAFVLGVS